MILTLRNSKKGLSALIAAVLMISFIAALVAVILSAFQENLIAGCAETSLDVKKLEGDDLLCYGDHHVEVTLEAEKIEGVDVEIRGHKETYSITLPAENVSQEEPITLEYSLLTYGDIRKITLIPLSEKSGSRCPSKAVVKQGSNLRRC